MTGRCPVRKKLQTHVLHIEESFGKDQFDSSFFHKFQLFTKFLQIIMERKAYLCLCLIFAFFFVGSFLLLVELTESKQKDNSGAFIVPTTLDNSPKNGIIWSNQASFIPDFQENYWGTCHGSFYTLSRHLYQNSLMPPTRRRSTRSSPSCNL